MTYTRAIIYNKYRMKKSRYYTNVPGVVAALLLYKKIFNIKAVFVRFRVFEDTESMSMK